MPRGKCLIKCQWLHNPISDTDEVLNLGAGVKGAEIAHRHKKFQNCVFPFGHVRFYKSTLAFKARCCSAVNSHPVVRELLSLFSKEEYEETFRFEKTKKSSRREVLFGPTAVKVGTVVCKNKTENQPAGPGIVRMKRPRPGPKRSGRSPAAGGGAGGLTAHAAERWRSPRALTARFPARPAPPRGAAPPANPRRRSRPSRPRPGCGAPTA